MVRKSSSILLAAPLFACVTVSGCAPGPAVDRAAVGPDTPGWTGRTLLPGSTSTINGAAAATYDQQKWPFEVDR
jgi:hypothetical protein